jgi:hypothetical protein
MKPLALCLGLIVLCPIPLQGQDLDTADVHITLDAALPLALETGRKRFRIFRATYSTRLGRGS